MFLYYLITVLDDDIKAFKHQILLQNVIKMMDNRFEIDLNQIPSIELPLYPQINQKHQTSKFVEPKSDFTIMKVQNILV